MNWPLLLLESGPKRTVHLVNSTLTAPPPLSTASVSCIGGVG